jgi:hypothetical protein
MVVMPDAEQLLLRLDRIQTLIDQLAKARGDFVEQQDLAERLRREIVAAKIALMPYGSHGLV